jgi:DUF1680 family protein
MEEINYLYLYLYLYPHRGTLKTMRGHNFRDADANPVYHVRNRGRTDRRHYPVNEVNKFWGGHAQRYVKSIKGTIKLDGSG